MARSPKGQFIAYDDIWLLDGVEHCGAYFEDRPAYVERVGRFFAQALGLPEDMRQHAG